MLKKNGWMLVVIIAVVAIFGYATTQAGTPSAPTGVAIIHTSTGITYDLGSPAGSFEQRGHWENAPPLGVAGEIRKASKSPWKYFIFTCDGRMCYKYSKPLSFWPESRAEFDAVTPELLENRWGYLGEIVFDSYPEQCGSLGEKATVIRYSIN